MPEISETTVVEVVLRVEVDQREWERRSYGQLTAANVASWIRYRAERGGAVHVAVSAL